VGGVERVLWSASLLSASLDERVDAAARNGFSALTVWPEDLERLQGEGRDPMQVAAEARQRGVERLMLEGLTTWYPYEPPRSTFPSANYSLDDHLRAAAAVGAHDVNIVALFQSTHPIEALTEAFAHVCDRCATEGVAVHLEFAPLPPVGSLATAWQIVEGAGRPNGGILFDTWHFFRGEPDLDLLASLPGDRIFSVQVSDGAAGYEESLMKDTFRHRRLPGDGVFDLVGVLRALGRIGGLALVGPEVLSVELNALAPAEAARVASDALDRVLAEAAAD
jgi:sugar phosphate isomerase/epimerase